MLSRHSIKPISYEAIYPPETLALIESVKKGRPRIPAVIKWSDALKKAMEAIETNEPNKIIEANDAIEKALVEYRKEIDKRSGDERAEFFGEESLHTEVVFLTQKTSFDSVDDVILTLRKKLKKIKEKPPKPKKPKK